ncbi:nucleobindin, partial [Tremellales sp. Uapishka_1]
MLSALLLLSLPLLSLGHGGHSHEDDPSLSYAEKHMQSEHHIDSFDLESFFKLHDLNNDGIWDELEIQAVYGLHHHSVREKIPQPEIHEGRTRMIVDKVLQRLDTNKDGKINLAEFLAGGNEGLPSFVGFNDLGHHHHIEAEEDARERIFEGLPEDADLAMDHVVEDPLEVHEHAEGEGPADAIPENESQAHLKAGDAVQPPKRPVRADPGAQPARFKKPSSSKADWDSAKEGAKGKAHDGIPRSAEERLRAGVPYKYKFRKGLRADEF